MHSHDHHQVRQLVLGPAPEPTHSPVAEIRSDGDWRLESKEFGFQLHCVDPAERTLKDFTPFAALGNPAQEVASKAKIEALLKEKKAKLWIQHDIVANAELKKSPAYYE